MSNNFPAWITKEMVKNIKSFNLDAYLLALEGWRRGLTLRWYYDASHVSNIKLIGFNPIGKIFSLSTSERTHFFYRSRGDKVSNMSVDIGTDKEKAKLLLLKNKVKTPLGKSFDGKKTKNDITKYAVKHLSFPIVVKPTFGSLGNGVFTNINTTDEIHEAIDYIRLELGYEDILVEEFIVGKDVRVYVVGDKVVAASIREPAHVVGDGYSTIEELIEIKNKERSNNPYLASRKIKVDYQLIDFISRNSYSINSVPDKGESVQLLGNNNVSSGGDSENITDVLSNNIKDVAVSAVKSIPGLEHGGVDMIVKNNSATVIEINTTASFGMHIFPSKGKPINVCKEIIDYYFPETKDTFVNEQLYFNYSNISKMLKNRAVNHLEVTNAINEPLYSKKYIVKGKVQGVGFRMWVRREASRYNLNGYTKNLKNGNVVVVVASSNQQLVNNFKEVLKIGSKRSKVEKVLEYDWDKRINIGFEIRK